MTMTITNRDYNSDLGNTESEKFKRLAQEVRTNVRTKLESNSKDFLNSMVQKFSEAENVNCQLKISVLKTSSITAEDIKEALESHLGNLTITDVTVVDSDSSTTSEPKTKSPTDGEDLFKVTATITDVEYTEELRDPSSAKFKSLSKDLTEKSTKVLRENLPSFRRVEIIRFDKGSVICIFNVITDVTKEESSVTEEKIRKILTDATSKGEMGNYTFGEIKVEKNKETSMKTGTEDKKWPSWVIALISASGVMLILIFVMSYLVRIVPDFMLISEYYSWISNELCSDDSLVDNKLKHSLCNILGERRADKTYP